MTELSRRTFIKVSASAGAMTLGISGLAPALHAGSAYTDRTNTTLNVSLNAWVKIAADDTVTIMVSQAEMGQGVQTTLPAIVADEMDADWSKVVREMTPVGKEYGNPRIGTQFTGNAESVRTFWPLLRKMGAAAREMLVSAAAQEWGVSPQECLTSNGVVRHPPSGQSKTYGALASLASQQAVPESPRLKSPEEWTLLRRSLGRVELSEKVTGAPIFGIDVEMPDMLHAAVRHAPTQNGSLSSFDKASLDGLSGIFDVVALPGAVAVVAETTWQAMRGLENLTVTFAPGPEDNFDSDSLDALYRATLDADAWTVVEDRNGAAEAIANAPENRVISSEYRSTWQSHAPMEPMNCTAHVTDGQVTIWAPTQGQTMVAVRVAEALGVPQESVSVERTYLGGGFGRRLIADYAVEAALISQAIGRPVKTLWSREEDIANDHYRPAVLHKLHAAITEDGLPAALDQKIVSPTILSAVIPSVPPTEIAYPKADPSTLEGAHAGGFRYGIDKFRLQAHTLPVPVKTMVWRTTGYGPNVFAIESFVDELAHAAQIDPIEYRIRLLERQGDNARARAVLRRMAEVTDWGNIPNGRARGIAFSHCFDSYIAQVAEISLDQDGTLDIHRIFTVLDGGYVLDPDLTKANIEGGVVWGLGQALTSEITFTGGAVDQSNWHDYTVLDLAETPPTELHYIDSGANPGGLGEVGPVTTAPALTNAIFAASGRRIYRLPLSLAGIHTRHRKQFI